MPFATAASLAPLIAVALIAILGCWSDKPDQVVVYTALDQEFSEPIFHEFTDETGIEVLGKFDTESTKTVGLYNAIMAESKRPRCDVFWNNEILNTLRLEKAGLLASYESSMANDYPNMYRCPEHRWYGFAARARILIVNTDLLAESEWPRSVLELADPKWKNKVGIAKPLFGTTASHAAVLFHRWGTTKATDFFTEVHANAAVMSGNKQVALAVSRGQILWGITDTDDAMVEIEKAQPVAIVYPDQEPEGLGTLFIPNCVAIIKGSGHLPMAQRFVDYVLSANVERALANGPSAQIPLRNSLQGEMDLRVKTPSEVKTMDVDFNQVADVWDDASRVLQETFAR